MGEQEEIQVVELNEFILSHVALALQPSRGASYRDNGPCFRQDFAKGVLQPYEDTFVAYQKGKLCGQSKNGELLMKKAAYFYGGAGLAVFQVPKNAAGIEKAIENAQGWVDKKPEISPVTSSTSE